MVGRITRITDGAGTEDRLLRPPGRDRPGDPGHPGPGQPGSDLYDEVPVRHLEPHASHHLSRPAQWRGREGTATTPAASSTASPATTTSWRRPTPRASTTTSSASGCSSTPATAPAPPTPTGRTTGGLPASRRRWRWAIPSTTSPSPTIRSATSPQLQNNAQFPGSFTGGNLGNAIGGPWTKTYAYDDLYRLTTSTGTPQRCADADVHLHASARRTTQSTTSPARPRPRCRAPRSIRRTTYDFAYSYPAPGSARPHAPTAIGPFTISNDANGNQTRTLATGTSDQSQYLFDEENRLACANEGPQAPSPSCDAQRLDPVHLRPWRRAQDQGGRKPDNLSEPVLHRLRRRRGQPVQAHLHRPTAHPDQEGAGRAGPAALVLPPGSPRLDCDGDQRGTGS